jgi:hypothetical protein
MRLDGSIIVRPPTWLKSGTVADQGIFQERFSMSEPDRAYFHRRAFEELHLADAALSQDIRILHIRWSHFYSDHLARFSG